MGRNALIAEIATGFVLLGLWSVLRTNGIYTDSIVFVLGAYWIGVFVGKAS